MSTTTDLTLRASSMPLAIKCPASVRPPEGGVRINPRNEAADAGTAVHAAMQELIELGELETPVSQIAAAHGADPDDVQVLTAMTRSMLRHIQPWVGSTVAVEMRIQAPAPWGRLTGQADWIFLWSGDEKHLGLFDLKTGRMDSDHYAQMISYAVLAFYEMPYIERVTPIIGWLRDSEIETYTFTRDGAMEWIEQAGDSIANWDGTYEPGAHCFSGDTRFITDEGVRSLKDACGEGVTVLDRHGRWVDAAVKAFGRQRLFKVTFDDGSNIRATADHRWWKMVPHHDCGWKQTGERITTMDLDRVPLTAFEHMPEIAEEGVRHGIVYGDGHTYHRRSWSMVKLQPHKAHLTEWFGDPKVEVEHYPGQVLTHRPVKRRSDGTATVTMQPIHFKALPERYSPSYARGFIAGLIATDGRVDGNGGVTISCEGLDRALGIAEVARVGGVAVSSVSVASTTWPDVMPGGKVTKGRARELCRIQLKPKTAPIISERQRANLKPVNQMRRMYRNVVSIEPDGFEDVYCAVVPGSEGFTLANGIATSNCEYCPRRHDCPARLALMRADIRELDDAGDEAAIDSMVGALVDAAQADPASADRLAELLAKAKSIEALADRMRKTARDRLAESGHPLQGEQHEISVSQVNKVELDAEAAWPVLAKVLGDDELRRLAKLPKTKTYDALRETAPRGKKKALVESVESELVGANALRTSSYQKLNVKRSKKSIEDRSKS